MHTCLRAFLSASTAAACLASAPLAFAQPAAAPTPAPAATLAPAAAPEPAATPAPAATPEPAPAPAAAPPQTVYVAVPIAEPARPREVPPEPPYERRVLGLGYKIGNGVGFIGGDIIVAPVDHLALDLQASYISYGSSTGYALVPEIQIQVSEAPRSTPYIGAGMLYLKMSNDGVTASGTGYFGNVGYEWRWPSGFGILLGGGIGYVAEITATDGTTTITRDGGAHVNLEFGLRYLIF